VTADLRLGLLLPTFDGDLRGHAALAVRAEAAGVDSVWLPDSPTQYRVPDPIATLGALAVATSRMTLGTGVLLAALRNPVLLAQAYATADALSGGRVVAGLGAGFGSPDSAAQFRALGAPFERRVGALVDVIAELRDRWSNGTVTPPAQAGGPPIWLAGAGERAERRVGRLADGWLPYLPDPRDYGEGLARVRTAALAAGRPVPVAGLYITVSLDEASASRARERLDAALRRWYGRGLDLVSAFQATYAGSAAGLAEHLAPYVEHGLQHVVIRIGDEPERHLANLRAALVTSCVA
jgi:alkanesulfonate monooxygenase SsuD/methylene tetrahydromethanopterin reductase-like flavin-dependent oxidoreductase (luciferase family)